MKTYDVYIDGIECLSSIPAVSFDHAFSIVSKAYFLKYVSLTIQRRLDGF